MEPAKVGPHDVYFRHAAMLQRNPIHTFMFDNTGRLLVANEAAIRASLHSDAGATREQLVSTTQDWLQLVLVLVMSLGNSNAAQYAKVYVLLY